MEATRTGFDLATVAASLTPNHRALLRRVHRIGAASRADLTRELGLNRSTVGVLVQELVERGLVMERDPAPVGRVGRPSPIVHPADDIMTVAVVPELDAITVGTVRFDRTVTQRTRYATDRPVTAQDAVNITASLVAGLRAGMGAASRIAGIGVAIPGLVRTADHVVRWAPHLEWRDEPIGQMLSEQTGLPVAVANDANVGALAEHRFGAARGMDTFVYLNGGASGIGSGIVVHDRLMLGSQGYAGEFGHNLVAAPGGEPGVQHELETEVSHRRLLAALGLAQASDEELDAALRASHSPEVRAELHRQAGVLGVGVSSLTNVFNPQAIVLGGFLSTLHDLQRERVRSIQERYGLAGSVETASVIPSQLGSELLLVGAAELICDQLVDDA